MEKRIDPGQVEGELVLSRAGAHLRSLRTDKLREENPRMVDSP